MVLEQILNILNLKLFIASIYMLVAFVIEIFICIGARFAHVKKMSIIRTIGASLLGTTVTGVVLSVLGFSGIAALVFW